MEERKQTRNNLRKSQELNHKHFWVARGFCSTQYVGHGGRQGGPGTPRTTRDRLVRAGSAELQQRGSRPKP